MGKRDKAGELNDRALKLQDNGKRQEAIELFQKAFTLDPSWAVPLFNLGLLFKNERKWQKSLEYNQRATMISPSYQGAWWNLGIAATALGNWQLARSAWRSFGLEVPDGDGPIDLPCGHCPIRLDPDGNAEVVWAFRIDPARAALASIPFPESKHRWNDIVLNDGAPTGYRKLKGEEVPVFNELELLEPSSFGTYVARVKMPDERMAIEKLAQLAADMGGSAEDWSTSVRIICKACSEGRLHKTHDTKAAPPDGVHTIGIAARDRRHATRTLSAWESERGDIQVESLDEALEAGKAQ